MLLVVLGVPYAGPDTFVKARYIGADRGHEFRADYVVIHVMQAPEKPGTARAVGYWFASEMKRKDGTIVKASTHYGVDRDEVVQYVPESFVAYGAGHLNRKGVHIELAGFTEQLPSQWEDEYSLMTLERAANLVADICDRHDIPAKKLSPDDLRNGHRGICGHVDGTNAFDGGKGHRDPGPSFPWDDFIRSVRTKLLPEGATNG